MLTHAQQSRSHTAQRCIHTPQLAQGSTARHPQRLTRASTPSTSLHGEQTTRLLPSLYLPSLCACTAPPSPQSWMDPSSLPSHLRPSGRLPFLSSHHRSSRHSFRVRTHRSSLNHSLACSSPIAPSVALLSTAHVHHLSKLILWSLARARCSCAAVARDRVCACDRLQLQGLERPAAAAGAGAVMLPYVLDTFVTK